MPRVLHAIDQNSPQATGPTLALMATALNGQSEVQQHVLLVGTDRLRTLAERCGLKSAGHLTMIRGRPWTSALAVRRWWKQQGGFDLIHCWSLGVWILLGFITPQTPRILTLTCLPTARELRLLRIWCRDRRFGLRGRVGCLLTHVPCLQSLLALGLEAESVQSFPPAVDGVLLEPARASLLRQRWGLAHPQAKVVAVVGDPPWQADVMLAALAVGLAEEARDRQALPLYLLVHPHQKHRRRALRALAAFGKRDRLIEEPELETPWRVLSGCDLAMAPEPNACGLTLLWAMAAGLPLIAPPHGGFMDWIPQEQAVFLVRQTDPVSLARCVGQILDDPLQATQTAAAIRTHVTALASPQQYRRTLADLYSRLLETGNTICSSADNHRAMKDFYIPL